MKEKFNFFNCMKYRCEQCKYNSRCEKEEINYEKIHNKVANIKANSVNKKQVFNVQFYNENIGEEKLKQEYLQANSRCKYKTPDELQARVEEYFGMAFQEHRPYTISGLAIYLGLSTETLRRYEKLYGDTEYAEIIKVAKQRVEEYAEKSLYDFRRSVP